MKDYYSILNVKQSSTTYEIREQYRELSGVRNHIGNTDYDNIHEVIRQKELKVAYDVLVDRNKRFKYDISHYGYVEYVDLDFVDVADKQEFVKVVLEEICNLQSSVKAKIEYSEGLYKRNNELLEQLLQEKTNCNIRIEIEKNRACDLEGVISDLLFEIDGLKEKVSLLKNIENEKKESDKGYALMKRQNIRLLQIAKGHKDRVFKLISIIVAFFLFIILIIMLNV